MNIRWLDTIDSTNSEALRRLPELPHGTVIAALEQTAGRGQRGNTWFSEPGRNLTFSLVLKFGPEALPPASVLPPLAAADAVRLNYLASLAVVRFLQDQGVGCTVKWPNDVYAGRRKICGILIENALDGAFLASSVVGIGININQRDFPQLANATSLRCLTGKELPLEECLQQVLAHIEALLPALHEGQRLFADYSALLFGRDVNARYHDFLTDREYTGVIQGVAPDGRLCIRDLDAPGQPLRYYRFKEVGFIL